VLLVLSVVEASAAEVSLSKHQGVRKVFNRLGFITITAMPGMRLNATADRHGERSEGG